MIFSPTHAPVMDNVPAGVDLLPGVYEGNRHLNEFIRFTNETM